MIRDESDPLGSSSKAVEGPGKSKSGCAWLSSSWAPSKPASFLSVAKQYNEAQFWTSFYSKVSRPSWPELLPHIFGNMW